ncbi:MAG: methyltransferase [Pseudomonadota bacterium]
MRHSILHRIFIIAASLLLAACTQQNNAPAASDQTRAAPPTPAPAVITNELLRTVLAKQPDDVQNRYDQRHPQQTLEFFGVKPGMTVVEALPGGGWYSKLLLPYLGEEGRLIGVNYAQDMWQHFGGFATPEYIERMKTWPTDWPAGAREWGIPSAASVDGFVFGAMPETMSGTADAVLLIRALHNMARFTEEGDYLMAALADLHKVLKPGGIVGIVQHEARPDMPDAWASGAMGYLKRDYVIDAMERAGFTLVGASAVNANPKDQPTTDDFVWRLPPSYAVAGEDADKRAMVDAIGESNRMTLKFVKS